MRVLLHTGKGGVGKTTMALATALGAARFGHRVFVLSTDSAHSLGDALGRSLGSASVTVAPGVVVRELGVLDEIDSAWLEIQGWLRELLREDTDEMVAEELLVFPGMEELLSLRAIREVEATGEFDVCVVDCAPTGSTLRMLRFPEVLRIFMDRLFDLERRGVRVLRKFFDGADAARLLPSEEFFDAFERLYREVDDVRQILLDNHRTSARLVMNPARIVVDESRRSFAYLNLYGVMTDAVLVNRVLPEAATAGYFARWGERGRQELEQIGESFPVPLLRGSLRAREPIGVPAIEEIAREVYGDADPARFFSTSRPIRVRKHGVRTSLEIDLPVAGCDEVDIENTGTELFVSVHGARRRISLPASFEGLSLQRSQLVNGVLEIVFGP